MSQLPQLNPTARARRAATVAGFRPGRFDAMIAAGLKIGRGKRDAD